MTAGLRVISLHAVTAGKTVRAAEFRWSPGNDVTLTVMDPRWGSLAQHYYDHGVPDRASLTAVDRAAGAEFMSALARLQLGSYCHLIVEK